MARKAIMFRTPVTLALILVSTIIQLDLAILITLLCAPFAFLAPARRGKGNLAETSEWAILILHSRYKVKVKELRNMLTLIYYYNLS
jgi:hypothetical protein